MVRNYGIASLKRFYRVQRDGVSVYDSAFASAFVLRLLVNVSTSGGTTTNNIGTDINCMVRFAAFHHQIRIASGDR